MSIIDDAITSLQAHALACTTLNPRIKAAPAYPVMDAAVLPLSIAHISQGTGSMDDMTSTRFIFTIAIDVHFNRQSIKAAYTQIDAFIPEFFQRLGGDPTLGGKVDTIVFPVSFNVVPAQWDQVTTQMVSFQVPVKFRETPTT